MLDSLHRRRNSFLLRKMQQGMRGRESMRLLLHMYPDDLRDAWLRFRRGLLEGERPGLVF